MISEEKKEALKEKFLKLNINEKEIDESFCKASGKGGQKVNKTDSAVVLKYPSKNIIIKCEKTRSREENRFFARRLLCEKIECELLGKKSPTELKNEKIRKQKKKRKKRSIDKIQ